jgi:hypothetical protein
MAKQEKTKYLSEAKFNEFLIFNKAHRFNIKTILKNFFDNLKIKNISLTNYQINQYITKIGKNKSKSLLNHFSTDCNNQLVLSCLTGNHLLSTDQVDLIIYYLSHVLIKENIGWNWIYNLKKLGFIFNDDQKAKLKDLGFIELTDQQQNLQALYELYPDFTDSIDNTDTEIDIFCKSNKITPDNNCIKRHCKIYNDIAYYYNKGIDYLKILASLQMFYKHKFLPDAETIMIILNYDYDRIYTNDPNIPDVDNEAIKLDVINDLVNHGAKFTDDHLKEVYETMSHKGKYNFSKFALQHGIQLTEYYFKSVIEDDDIYNIINGEINDNTYKKELYKLFIDDLKFIPDEQFCDSVCRAGNYTLFQLLIDRNLFIITKNSLPFSCFTAEKDIICNLINMKAEATNVCVANLPFVANYYNKSNKKKSDCLISQKDEEILNILISGGLVLDYEIINILYKKGICLDLIKYDIINDDNIYFIVHENTSLANTLQPVGKYVDKSKCEYYSKFYFGTLEEIQQEKLIPNQFCYDNAICNIPVRQWLEETYNFKPTFITLSRIVDFKLQKEVIDTYFSDPNKYNPYVGSNKMYYVK